MSATTIRPPELPPRRTSPARATAATVGAGRPVGRPASAALVHAARAGLATLRLWLERAEQRRQLADLPDYLLKDIGLSRAQVAFEINKPFWRP